LDNTPPVTTSNIPFETWNQTDTFLLRLQGIDSGDTEHDIPSGLAATYYTLDGSEPNYSSPSGPNQPDNITTEVEITGQGKTTVKFFSIDNNGNQEFTKTQELWMDNVAPVSSLTVVDPDGENGWYKTNPTILISATDGTSGLRNIFYRWNSDTFQSYLKVDVQSGVNDKINFEETPSVELTGIIDPGSYDGPTLASKIRAALNTAGSSVYTVTFDIITRKITIISDGAGGIGILNILWATGTNTSTSVGPDAGFDVTDDTGALTYIGENVIQAVGNSFQMPSEGLYTLDYYAIDFAGNTEDLNSHVFKLDNVAPVTADDAPEGLQKEPVTIHFFSSDDISGINNIYFTTDGSTPDITSSSGTSVILDETGNYIIKYFGVDNAGNEESVKQATVEVSIDLEAPNAFVSESFPPNGTNGWYRTTPDITVSATDPSGIKAIYYKLHETGVTSTAKYTSTVEIATTIDLSTNYKVNIEIDNSGIPEEIEISGFLPSETTLVEIIGKINNAIGQDVAVETDAEGDESGENYITIKSLNPNTATAQVKFLAPTGNDATNEVFGLDEGAYPHTYSETVIFLVYTSPVTLPHDAHWTLEYYAIDNEDNVGEVKSKEYKLDGTSPVTTLTIPDPDGNNGWYVTDQDITLSAEDNLSGVYKMFYRWDEGIVVEYKDGDIINFPSEGIHTLYYYSSDLAGNIENQNSYEIKYDKTPPETIDDSIRLQGIIYTTFAAGYQYIEDEHPSVISLNRLLFDNNNVVSISRIYNETKLQYYYPIRIDGVNRNEVIVEPLTENEQAIRISNYVIQIASDSISRALRVFNVNKNAYYEVDFNHPDTVIGIFPNKSNLKLSGEYPIDVGDVVEIDYIFGGVPLSVSDYIYVDYAFDVSGEPQALNTLDRTILEAVNAPLIHDHPVTINFRATDNASLKYRTYYTTDGSTPTQESAFGDSVTLIEDGTYTLKYFSVDNAGNVEDVKEAVFPIIIDRRIPQLDITYIPDPSETGTNGWYNKDFGLHVEITTDDTTIKLSEEAVPGPLTYEIISGENDRLSIQESADIFNVIIPAGTYSGTDLKDEVATKLNAENVKDLFEYTADIEKYQYGDGEKFTINSKFKVSVGVNDKIDFEETAAVELTATLNSGQYTSTELETEIKTRLDLAGASTYTVAYDTGTNKFTITSDGTGGGNIFNLLWLTGTNTALTAGEIIGYDITSDNTGSLAYLADYSPITFLWTGGESIGETLGYDISSNIAWFDSYESDYLRIRLYNKFLKEVIAAHSSISQEQYTIKGVQKGLGLYDEVLMAGNIHDAIDFVGEVLDPTDPVIQNIPIIDGTLEVWDTEPDPDVMLDLGIDYSYNDENGAITIINQKYRINTGVNDKINFEETVAVELTATIAAGVYTSTTLANEIESKLEAVGASNYTISFNSGTGKFTLSSNRVGGGGTFTLLWATGTDTATSIGQTIGFAVSDDPNSESHVGDIKAPHSLIANYKIKDKILSDYEYFVGIESLKLGYDSVSLNKTITVVNDLTKFDSISPTEVKFIFDIPAPLSTIFPGYGDGEHTIFARAYDNNSIPTTGENQKASAYSNLPFKLDRIAPITTDDVVDLSWRQGPVTINISVVDVTSGLYRTYFTINGTTPTVLSPIVVNSKIILYDSGEFIIKYFSVDIAGNIEAVKEAAFHVFVDGDAPTTQLFTNPVTPTGEDDWFVSPTVQITLVPVDIHSGVDKTYYRLADDLLFVEYTAPFLMPEGAYDIEYYAVDNVGNEEIVKTTTVKFDKTPPVTTTDVPPSGFTSSTRINFIVDDEASGWDTTFFTIDGSTPTIASPSGHYVDINSSGTFTLKYFSRDNAGNIETVNTEIVKIDLIPPVIYDIEPPDGVITESTTEFKFKVSDDFSGVDVSSIKVEVNGIEYSQTKNSSYFSWVPLNPTDYEITISPIQGVLNFEDVEVLRIYNVSDIAGNIADEVIFNFIQADTEAPRVRELYPTPNSTDVSTKTNVIAYIDDNQSGVNIRTVQIKINNVIYKPITRDTIRFRYTGSSTNVRLTIDNVNFVVKINSIISLQLNLSNNAYNTIKKLADYLNGLDDYEAEIINSKYNQELSKYLLNENNLDITVSQILDLFLFEDNLNFSFFERNRGYIVFATPTGQFEHNASIIVIINAIDHVGNVMVPFEYRFTTHITASRAIQKRNDQYYQSLEYIKDIFKNMGSSYSRSPSTIFYGHLKSHAMEQARLEYDEEKSQNDLDYDILDPKLIWQNLGYLITIPPSNVISQEDYRQLLLALISILFEGSTKTSLQRGLELFVENDVQLREPVFSKDADISEQFIVKIDVLVEGAGPLDSNLSLMSEQINAFMTVVKPSHIFYIIRFIWTEHFYFQNACELQWEKDPQGDYILDQWGRKIPILDIYGWQVAIKTTSTAICDRYKVGFENLYPEDMRTDCSEYAAEIQEITENVSNQFLGEPTKDDFFTYFKPWIKEDEFEIAELTDFVVTINGTPVSVDEFDPTRGYVKLTAPPNYGDQIEITYYYNEFYVYRHITFYLNDFTVDGSDFDPTEKSIFNTFNVNDYLGGFEFEGPLHAHVCTQLRQVTFEWVKSDDYVIPPCNSSHRFILNDYRVDGSDFDPEVGSYFNDYYTRSYNVHCPRHEITLNYDLDDLYDQLVDDWTDLLLGGSFFQETKDLPTDSPTVIFMFGDYLKKIFILNKLYSPLVGSLPIEEERVLLGSLLGVDMWYPAVGFSDTYASVEESNPDVGVALSENIEEVEETIGQIVAHYKGFYLVPDVPVDKDAGILNGPYGVGPDVDVTIVLVP